MALSLWEWAAPGRFEAKENGEGGDNCFGKFYTLNSDNSGYEI